MSVVVIGAGAVGLGLGSFLLQAGQPVCFVVRSAAGRARLRKHGLQRSGIFGEHHTSGARLDLVDSVEALRGGEPKALLVCTKSSASKPVADALGRIWKHFAAPAPVLLCQNGWGNAEVFAVRIPSEKVFNARVITGFERSAANTVKLTVHAEPMHVGSLYRGGARDEALLRELCAAIESSGLPCRWSTEIEKDLWAKMLYNCALNPLGALLGVAYG